jgi:hypothetical protein
MTGGELKPQGGVRGGAPSPADGQLLALSIPEPGRTDGHGSRAPKASAADLDASSGTTAAHPGGRS